MGNVIQFGYTSRCRWCKGTGIRKGTKRTCTSCEGTGYTVPIPFCLCICECENYPDPGLVLVCIDCFNKHNLNVKEQIEIEM